MWATTTKNRVDVVRRGGEKYEVNPSPAKGRREHNQETNKSPYDKTNAFFANKNAITIVPFHLVKNNKTFAVAGWQLLIEREENEEGCRANIFQGV